MTYMDGDLAVADGARVLAKEYLLASNPDGCQIYQGLGPSFEKGPYLKAIRPEYVAAILICNLVMRVQLSVRHHPVLKFSPFAAGVIPDTVALRDRRKDGTAAPTQLLHRQIPSRRLSDDAVVAQTTRAPVLPCERRLTLQLIEKVASGKISVA